MRLLPVVLTRWLGRLRYPQLFGLAGALLLLDFVVPDPIPFLDEVLLGAVTLLLSQLKSGAWRRGDGDPGDGYPGDREPRVKDVTPRDRR
jgi:hypothetical protein